MIHTETHLKSIEIYLSAWLVGGLDNSRKYWPFKIYFNQSEGAPMTIYPIEIFLIVEDNQ